MQRQIDPEDAQIGMYVRKFGGSWFDHPFWRARFVLETSEDVARVRESGVPYILIDDELGARPAAAAPDCRQGTVRAKAPNPYDRRKAKRPSHPEEPDDRFDRQRAKALVAGATRVLRAAFSDVRLGRAVRMSEVTSVVEEVVESVDRSPRTLLEVLRLKKKDEYTYTHSVAVCTLMVNAARHLGKSAAEVQEFGLAGLLHDLGKVGISDDILNKPGKLTEAEHGYRMLAQSPNMPEAALDVCRHHHEKMDGTGYPFGLPADDISLVARLGGICDVYDALTSERVYKDAWSPVEAIAQMWSWAGHFDRALLFTFMQSIAVFPPGMVVQLRTNRLGLVLENKRRNSRPRVLVFYATREREPIEPEVVVIEDSLSNDSIVATADPAEWGINDWEALLPELAARQHLP